MPRIPIIAYSYTGNNRRLARHLGERLDAQVIEVQERHPRRGFDILLDLLFRRRPKIRPLGVDARAYDHVLYVGPIWDRHDATPLLGAMDELSPVLRSYSFASLCGYERPGQRDAIRDELVRRLGRPPEHVAELVVGHLFPTGQRRRIRVVSGYRVTVADLTHFEAELSEIIDGLRDKAGARRSAAELQT